MAINYFAIGEECPNCHKKTLFLASTKKPIEIDGESVRPMTQRCTSCNWELPEADVIKSWRYMVNGTEIIEE